MANHHRTRLLAAFAIIAFVAAAALSLLFLREAEAFGVRKLEERLEGQARLLATLLAPAYSEAVGPSLGQEDARELRNLLGEFGAEAPSRIRVLDTSGRVIADSGDPSGVGQPYGEREEVREALAGRRSTFTRATPEGRLAMYVAVPVVTDGGVRGVAYVSATTFSVTTLLRDNRDRLIVLMLAYVAVTLVVTELLARWMSSPLTRLAASAQAFAAGDHATRAQPTGSRETRAVADAFNRLAEEVERMVSELRQEERRKSRFVSDVSHELRTPLTAIRGAAETLLEGGVDPADETRFLRTIVDESDRLGRLASDLIALQRIEGATGELPMRRIDLGEAVRRAVQSLAPVLSERGVTVTIAGETADVLGDADRLQQVTANLVDNAARVSPQGTTVEVSLGIAENMAEIRVADAGPGIDAEDLPHIFDRFYRSQLSRDRSTGGAGLGLAIVKAIVTAHAGSIDVANREDGGSVFTVRIPALID